MVPAVSKQIAALLVIAALLGLTACGTSETTQMLASKLFAVSVGIKESHWFHTKEQMQFLDDWLRRSIP